MTAFLRLWLPCAVLTWLIVPGLTYVVDNRIDLTIEQFSRLVWVPAVQAGVLLAASASRRWTARPRVTASRPWRHGWARGVAGTSVLLLGLAWMLRAHPALGTSAPRPLLVTWVGTLLVAASLLLLRATRGPRATVLRQAAASTRVLAVASALVGAECLTGGLGATFRSLVPLPTVLRWFVLYGAGVMVVFAILGWTAGRWRRAGAVTEAAWLDVAGGLGFVVASAWVVNAFVRPYWTGVAGFAVLGMLTVASTMLVSAALSLAVEE
jgi:hypothetical protein